MGLFGNRKKHVSRGVFGRQVAEDEAPPLVKQLVLLLDDLWEHKVEPPSLAYANWWESRQRDFHRVSSAAVRLAVASLLAEDGTDLNQEVPERQAGRALADAFAAPGDVLEELGQKFPDEDDMVSAAAAYQSDVVRIALALVDRYGVSEDADTFIDG